jgi:hypothetical protein
MVVVTTCGPVARATNLQGETMLKSAALIYVLLDEESRANLNAAHARRTADAAEAREIRRSRRARRRAPLADEGPGSAD